MAYDSSDLTRYVKELTTQMDKFDIVLRAYYELMQEKGISQEQLNAKIDDILARKVEVQYGGRKKPCPKCGKMVGESKTNPMRGKCMICGTDVAFYPFEDDVKEDEEAKPYDPSEDLGF